MRLIRVRIKATGQVLDMIPSVANAMIAGRTAEKVGTQGELIENAAIDRSKSAAIAPAQHSQSREEKRKGKKK